MDPFTKGVLERAEQRSRTLGISKSTKFPLSEYEQKANQQQQQQQLQQTQQLMKKQRHEQDVAASSASSTSPSKVVRNYSVDKENMDVGIEINITTGHNVEVQVEVEEKEIGADGKCIEPQAQIRDSSRNRLQRLGALYSETENLSSPIHRTEAQFHEEDNDDLRERQNKRPKQKFGKLTALADSIKNWEDDTSHPDYKAMQIAEAKAAACSPKKKAPVITQVTEKPTYRCVKIIPLAEKQSAPRSDALEKKKMQWEKSVGQENKLSQEKDRSSPGKGGKEKKLQWDKNVMDSLEAQGFQRRESGQTKYSYEYNSSEKPSNHPKQQTVVEQAKSTTSHHAEREIATTSKPKDDSKISNVRSGLVSGRAAIFESKATVVPSKPQKDPAEMSLKERMMFFEKNKGEALIPKAAFAMSAPVVKTRDETKKLERRRDCDQQQFKSSNSLTKGDGKVRDKVAALAAGASTISESKIKADIMKQRQQDMDILAKRFNRQKEMSESSTITTTTTTEEIMSPPPPPPMPHSSNEHLEIKQSTTKKRRSPGIYNSRVETQSSSDEKRIKVNPTNKPGRLYPVLSDIEVTSTESDNDNCTTATISARSGEEKHRNYRDDDSDEEDEISDKNENESFMGSEDSDAGNCNVSLGREIMRVVRSNETAYNSPQKNVKYVEPNSDAYNADSSVNSGITSDGSADIDDYLDEALDEDSDSEIESNSKQKTNGTTSSNSFSYKKQPKSNSQYQSIAEEGNEDYRCSRRVDFSSPVKSALTVNPSDDNNMVTLVHTVSFYRRQQSSNSNNSTPVRRIQREQKSPGNDSKDSYDYYGQDSESEQQEDMRLVQDKIKKLLDEVCKQQQVIAQTSQALNLCASTVEFSGSTESVEGERHLLVATHRRQAALDEVQRLRVEGSIRPHGAPKEKGRLTVREITVPLRQDYIRKLSADTISGHHLVCLLKYNENVLATKTIPTLPGLLAVKFPDILQLNNAYADFKITLEIYGMTAQREVLPHEVKYHINLNKKSGSKTPKSKKGGDSRLVMPMVQSPAGPHVVRTPALVQYGFSIFSLREIQRNTWSLTPSSGVSPLEGVIHMKINCELSVSVEYKGFLTMYEDISGFGAWHRRWCHLNGHVLNYWKYPDDERKKTPMGSIDLYACCSPKITTAPRDVCARLNTLLLECQRPAESNDVESLIIVPRGKITIVRYLLSADTKDERDEWVAYFNKALSLLRAWGSQN